ncbi:MAG: hypothetical protein HEQ32_01065 [Vampirovibrio sp.]
MSPLVLFYLYMSIKRVLPTLSIGSQLFAGVGALSWISWGLITAKLFNAEITAPLIQILGFPLQYWLPAQQANLLIMGLFELLLFSVLQNFLQIAHTYLKRNQHLEREGRLLLKQQKQSTPVAKRQNVSHYFMITLLYKDTSQLSPLYSDIQQYHAYQGKMLPYASPYTFVCFDSPHHLNAYLFFLQTKMKEYRISPSKVAMALDYLPVFSFEDEIQVNKIVKDAIRLCDLDVQGGIVCTHDFLQKWSKNTSKNWLDLRQWLEVDKPLIEFQTLSTTSYFFGGTMSKKSVHHTTMSSFSNQ